MPRHVRELLSFLPSNNLDDPPRKPCTDPIDRADAKLDTIVPLESNQPYDIKDVINTVVDDGYFFEVPEHYAKNIVIGFARLNGRPSALSLTSRRFWRACSTSAPAQGRALRALLRLLQRPADYVRRRSGFLPGTEQEYGGIIKHGAKLLFAFAEATVPKITVITRKAYGGAYDVMASKHIRADVNLAFPTAEIAVMGPEGAVNIVYRREPGEVREPRGRSRGQDRRISRPLRQSVRRSRAGIPGRGDSPARHPPKTDSGSGDAGEQARQEPAEEAPGIYPCRKKLSAVSSRHQQTAEVVIEMARSSRVANRTQL